MTRTGDQAHKPLELIIKLSQNDSDLKGPMILFFKNNGSVIVASIAMSQLLLPLNKKISRQYHWTLIQIYVRIELCTYVSEILIYICIFGVLNIGWIVQRRGQIINKTLKVLANNIIFLIKRAIQNSIG